MVIGTEKTKLRMSYPADGGRGKQVTCDIAYEGDFIPPDSGLFSPVTARISGALAMSSADAAMLEANLRSLGYKDIVMIAFDSRDDDKIGLCLANRIGENGIEIAAVLRGTSGNEWYSNFDIGYTAEHHGFATAADFAELRLGDYVFTHAIGYEPRFFITGYSRGGAVANILAKRLCDRYGIDRVWCYTFAAPSTTISRRVARYSCIFNLVRDEDFFTRVPPAGWGYTKYGRNICLSDTGSVAARYRELTGEEYIGFTHQAPVDNFLCAVMTLAPNTHAYYERRRQVGERRLSLYEFMTSVADMLSANMDETVADIFMSAMVSDYADLMSFLSSGADLGDILSSSGGAPRCSVADSHNPAAYMAALETFLG